MARDVARTEWRSRRFGFRLGVALTSIASVASPADAKQEAATEAPLATYESIIARLDAGASLDVADAKTLGWAAQALTRVEGAARLDGGRLIAILDRTMNEVLRAGLADGASFFAGLLVEELIRAGRAADVDAQVAECVRSLEAKHAKSVPFALTKLHRAHRLLGEFDRLEEIDARCAAALGPLENCPVDDVWTRAQWFGLLEERIHLAECLGLPDRMRFWIEQARAAASGLDHERFAVQHRNLRLMEIDAATAAGDQAAAFDAIERAEAAGDPPAALRFRRAIASTRTGSDPRAFDPTTFIDILRRALSDESLLAENRAQARIRLASSLLGTAAYEDVARLVDSALESTPNGIANPIELLGFRVEAMLHLDTPVEALTAATDSLHEAIVDRIEKFSRSRTLDTGSGPLYFPTVRTAYASWIDATLRLDPEHGVERAIELLLAGQESGTFARRVDARCASVGAIRTGVLHRDEGLVLFLPATRRTGHAFAIDVDGVAHAPIPDSSDLAKACAALFERACERPPREDDGTVKASETRAIQSLQQTLGSALFPAPIARRMERWKRVVICGADSIGTVPYEACIVGNDALGRSHGVRVVGSLPVAAFLAARSRPGGTRRSAVFFANRPARSFADNDPRVVPFDVDPLRIERLATVLDADTFVGAEASASALRGFDGRGAAVQVIVAHGTIDDERLRPVVLACAGESRDAASFSTDDAEASRPAGTVVIAACGAASGPRRAGDDGLHLFSGALLFAGARTVVIAVGPADLQASLRLIEDIAPSLRAGTSVAEAMRAARARLTTEVRFDHPYYWSQLQVIGADE
ncbi:MAG: CHAT domain-containing protein [Planctomycetes bacterium]|nr:CHAT domain-containing protein [Planctomycetota bacterium]MCC7170931.1 CHAT domain-containing protein [Planctomycetota bacterium]